MQFSSVLCSKISERVALIGVSQTPKIYPFYKNSVETKTWVERHGAGKEPKYKEKNLNCPSDTPSATNPTSTVPWYSFWTKWHWDSSSFSVDTSVVPLQYNYTNTSTHIWMLLLWGGWIKWHYLYIYICVCVYFLTHREYNAFTFERNIGKFCME